MSRITSSGPLGKYLGLIWYKILHKDSIHGSRVASYLKNKEKTRTKNLVFKHFDIIVQNKQQEERGYYNFEAKSLA